LAETAAGRASVPITRPETGEAPRERAPSGAGAPGSPLPELTEVREVHREVLARRGDPVELSFEGEGWLFASGGRGSGADVGREAEGLEFGGSSSGQGRTRFSFTARALGEYSLIFQLQDHQAGMLRNEVVRLRVLDDEAFARELTGAAGAAGGAGDPEYPWRAGGSESAAGPIVSAASTGEHLGAVGASVPRADRLFELGEYELALDSYLREYRAGDPYLNERIAESYAAIGDYGAAATYYRVNLRGPADYRDRAIVGLVRSALALEDEKLVIDTIPALLTVESVPVQTELLGLARYLHLRARGAMAMELLGEYARRYPFGAGMDEALYRMAQLYESESVLRDLAAARSTYRRVYREWPESPFSEPAYQRLQYLERHFFDVR
jgi:tetratricopeptide (TPR) repeat protein